MSKRLAWVDWGPGLVTWGGDHHGRPAQDWCDRGEHLMADSRRGRRGCADCERTRQRVAYQRRAAARLMAETEVRVCAGCGNQPRVPIGVEMLPCALCHGTFGTSQAEWA